MNHPINHPNPSQAAVHASLRDWARGAYGDEAAVELVIRSFHGRFALPDWPWISRRERADGYWLDADAINPGTGLLSGGEQRVLAIVAALAGSQQLDRSLADIMSGVDRDNRALILAALSHAGGSHQQNGYQRRPDGTYRILEAKALIPWPERTDDSRQAGLPLSTSDMGGGSLGCRRTGDAGRRGVVEGNNRSTGIDSPSPGR